MTPEQYARIRKQIGTQYEVAALLQKDRSVITRREKGLSAIDHEAELAIRYLLFKHKQKAEVA